MKLSVSPKSAEGTRHLVLKVASDEDFIARPMINQYVLGKGVASVRRRGPDGVTYLFALRYLDKLMLAMPNLELSTSIRNKLFAEEQKRQAALPVPPMDLSDLRADLRPYQVVGAGQMVLKMSPGFMLTDEMGLGKTMQVLAALCDTMALPALVICPNNAKYNWEREIRRFTDFTVQVVDGTAAERDYQIRQQADITIANFAQIRVTKRGRGDDARVIPSNPAFFEVHWETLIADEFHNLKTAGAQQTQGYLMLDQTCFIGLSGTPVLNDDIGEMWPTLHKIDPSLFPSHTQMSAQLKTKIGVGNRKETNPIYMAELRAWVEEHSLRRRKDQVEKDLPQAVRLRRDVELTKEQRALYERILNDFMLELEDGSEMGVPTFLSQITRLKQACLSPELYEGSPKSAKIDELKLVVKELVANGEKALIFSQWSTATRIIERELAEYNPAYVDGSVKSKDRMAQVDKFQNEPDCQIYIGTIGSNKEAISLGEATYVIFTDKGWTPAEIDQAIGRSAAGGLRGLGKEGMKITVVELYAVDTIEERIESLLQRKANLFRRFVEADGGPQVEKGVLSSLRSLFTDEMAARKK